MSIGATSGTTFAAVGTSTSVSPVLPDKADDAKDVVAAFRKEAKKSPIDRIRESVLKKHHLTSEQLDRLPAEQQSAIQREIADAIKRAVKGNMSGTNANVLV